MQKDMTQPAEGGSRDGPAPEKALHVIVALSGIAQSERLIGFAARLIEGQAGSWTVVTVEAGRSDAARQVELARMFELARRHGGDAVVLHGTNVAEALLDHAQRSGASIMIVGRDRRMSLARILNRTVTQQLIDRGPHLTIAVVGTESADGSVRLVLPEPTGLTAKDASIAIASASAATAIGLMAERWIGLDDLSLVFIVAVVLVASRARMAAAVLASVLSFLAYNFVFIDPRLTLTIAAPEGLATIVLFLVAALVAGRLASRLRTEVLALKAANAHTIERHALSRELTGAANEEEVLAAGAKAFRRSLGADPVIGLGERAAEVIPDEGTGPEDARAANWTMQHAESSGRFADRFRDSRWWYLPLTAGSGCLGFVGLRFPPSTIRLDIEQRRLAEAMTADLAQALVRVRLVGDLQEARINNQTERLRSALLASVSHDLRSPLATIIGAAGSLDSYGDQLGSEDRHSLLDAIRVEGQRLDRYVGNLLDMTRLGDGGLQIRRDWIGVDELIGAAVGRVKRDLPHARFELRLPRETGPIWVHPALIEQALYNVLENAVGYSPPDVGVVVTVRLEGGRLEVDVCDGGPGIPESERERIFDMFHRVERGDRARKGTGMGLSICRGMISAHGGTVEALQPSEGFGAIIRVSLPEVQPDVD